MKKIIQWLIMRKVKNAAGELEARGYSVAKIAANALILIEVLEFAGPKFGYPIIVDPSIKTAIASIGAIGMKEGVDRSAPTVPAK